MWTVGLFGCWSLGADEATGHLKSIDVSYVGLSQFDVFFCSLAAIGFLLWVYNMYVVEMQTLSHFSLFRDNDPAVEQKRLLLLGTFGFLKGAARVLFQRWQGCPPPKTDQRSSVRYLFAG